MNRDDSPPAADQDERGVSQADEKLAAAVSLFQAGRLGDAKRIYVEILSVNPDHAVALNYLGVIMLREGDAEQGLALIGQAIALRPDYLEAYGNLGIVLKDLGRLDEAAAALRKALELDPDVAKTHYNLANVLSAQGELDKAVAAYDEAVRLKPDYVAALNNLGTVLTLQGELETADTVFRKALAHKPEYAEAYGSLGVVLTKQGRLDEAVSAFDEGLKLNGDDALTYNNLGGALTDQGKLAEALAARRQALALNASYADAHSSLLFGMNYDPRMSQHDIYAESRRWEAVHVAHPIARQRPRPVDPDADRRLRVGYVSPDFRRHSVSYFIGPLVAGHDRRAFEVFCYAEVARPDDWTARIRERADAWRSTVGMDDPAVAAKIREDGIDILVDLAGHTDKNRLLVFAERPAPVQVSWLGYPNTTGLTAMDYRLTDAIADPAAAADALYSETLVRLAGGFLCYGPAVDAPEVGACPVRRSGEVTFGSFNVLAKVTPETVAVWAEILDHVPGSRLLMKNRSLADEKTRTRYLRMFTTHGIAAGRIELCSWIASSAGHLGAYGRVDIGLDPFPYNGTTTTCEALWMGVPVITLSGDRHSGRVGASILTRVGLADLVTGSTAAYVEKAVALANDLDRLSTLRGELRGRLERSPLCDAPGFTRDIEAAYREMWCRACA